ncbi:MAG: S41 family peptidase [Clostridia bacterium]|jgi:carboxyl-terminal processing protease|nr:S41 family peptidase [Clostridia bacterium]
MEKNTKQKIYKVVMLIILVALITFILTSIFMYKYFGEGTRYLSVSPNDGGISTTLATFKKIIDQKFLGEIDDQKVLNETIKGYIKGLGDPYTEYLTKEEMQDFDADVMGNFVGIGVYLTQDLQRNVVLILAPIPGSPAEGVGIQAGDIITKIDGESYTGEQLSEASSRIKGEEGTKVKLEILRGETSLELEIIRQRVKINHVEGKVIENNIGYIKFNSFDEGCSEEFEEKLKELKEKNIQSLIIDIRNNGGGIVSEAIDIADLIVEKDSNLLITVDKNDKEEIRKAKKEPIINLPIILLTNESSASAAEILAGALKDNNKARIVGEKTYGKGVIQELLKLKDGSGLKITTNEYFTPNKNKINKVGIQPDIEEKGEDRQLQVAIEQLSI